MHRQLNRLAIPKDPDRHCCPKSSSRFSTGKYIQDLSAVAGLLVISATAADAYIGPGAGLSLLGALWALIAAIATALAFIVLWPWRQARKRRAAQKKGVTAVVPPSAASDLTTRDPAAEAMHETPEAPTH